MPRTSSKGSAKQLKSVKPVQPEAPEVKATTSPGESSRRYLREYGYDDEFIDAYFAKCDAMLRAGLDRAQRPDELEGEPVDRAPIEQLLWVERRAALVEKRDPAAITPENVREIARRRTTGTLRQTVKIGDKRVSTAPMAEVKNEAGVEVKQTQGGRFLVYGYPHTKIFVWAGRQGWELEDVQTMVASIGLPEISEASIKTFLRAGAKGEKTNDPNNDGRGPHAALNPKQAAALTAAAGK